MKKLCKVFKRLERSIAAKLGSFKEEFNEFEFAMKFKVIH